MAAAIPLFPPRMIAIVRIRMPERVTTNRLQAPVLQAVVSYGPGLKPEPDPERQN